ncbi:MAG: thiaminase II [Thermoprotei archaeon]
MKKPSEILWEEVREIFSAVISHPFIEELSKGLLDEEIFKYYVIQDALYLDEYSRVLATLAGKAPREEWVKVFAEDSIAILEFEKALHEEYFSMWGVTPEDLKRTPLTPTNMGYVNHLWRTVLLNEFPVGVAAVTPCYWVYLEVGRYLEKMGSPHKLYSKWISLYSSKEYAKYVERVLEILNEILNPENTDLWSRALRAFKLSTIYEYMFWDSAYKKEYFTFNYNT